MKKLTSRFSSKQRAQNEAQVVHVDSPEFNAPRGVRLFCEKGAEGTPGEEVLHLPVIVEAAESSPQAAAAAANEIRTLLGKEYFAQPQIQYNAIMLIRILANNPGRTFTKNLDLRFAGTVKELLRNCRDPSVQQIMRETLDALESEKAYDENLIGMMAMWRKEKGAPERGGYAQYQITQARNLAALNPVRPQHAQRWTANENTPKVLPAPAELAGRIEEGKTTAKILMQLVASTPTAEVTTNDLIKEFSQRAQAASRSLQGYMNCTPGPDPDTLQTLIETCEQLSLASSRHQRAVLQARRAQGAPPPQAPAAQVPPAAAAAAPLATAQPQTYTVAWAEAQARLRSEQQPLDPPHSAPLQAPEDFRLPQAAPQATSTSNVQRSASVRQQLPPSNPYSERPSPVFSPATTSHETHDSPTFATQSVSPPFNRPSIDDYSTPSARTFGPPAGPPPDRTHADISPPMAYRPKQSVPNTMMTSAAPPVPHSNLYDADGDDLYSDTPSPNLYDTSPVHSRQIGTEQSTVSPVSPPRQHGFAARPSTPPQTQTQGDGPKVSPLQIRRAGQSGDEAGQQAGSAWRTKTWES